MSQFSLTPLGRKGGKYKIAPIPRSKRICEMCAFEKCEDELHLFECPFYNDIRQRFQSLFSSSHNFCDQDQDMVIWIITFSDNKMCRFMNPNCSAWFWKNLADYFLACKKRRQLELDKRMMNLNP